MAEKSINILVSHDERYCCALGQEYFDLIASVGPKIRVADISDWVRAEYGGDQANKGQLDSVLQECEIMLVCIPPQDFVGRSPKLKWIHSMVAGVNHFWSPELEQSRITVTSSKGLHSTQISEFVFELLLLFVKRAPLFFQLQQEKKWVRHESTVLRGKTIGILGLGHIGKEVARLAKAFGMRVVAIRRSVKTAKQAKNVDLLLPPGQLLDLLSESDFVVILLPRTPETDNLIGEAELKSMKPTAYLINVGRGTTVVEQSLVRALKEKWIAGAGLDAFVSEPLPPDHELWELPNVILTPHCSGLVGNYAKMTSEFFCENLNRYLNGGKLLNIVDKRKGY